MNYTSGALVHYGAKAWQEFQTSAPRAEGGPVGVWGDGQGSVYYATTQMLGRWTAAGEQVLLDFRSTPQRSISGFAPVSPSEIFVSVLDSDLKQYRCGASVLLWFDGSEFHRF